jgi:hypothetical protein
VYPDFKKLRSFLLLKTGPRLNSRQDKPCGINIDFNDFAVYKFFSFTQNVLRDYVGAFNFGVNYIFELDFTV